MQKLVLGPFPFGTPPGQAPKLVLGQRRVKVDTSAFSKLTAPPKEPGIITPGGKGPMREPYQVAQGLGLTADAERDLTTTVGEWIQLPDQLALRRAMVKGLQGFANTTYPVRREIWHRVSELWRNTESMRPYRPRAGQQIIQKGGERIPGGLAGDDQRVRVSSGDAVTGFLGQRA